MAQELTSQMIRVEERTTNENIIELARMRWSRIKGKFVPIPDLIPHTEVFVRKGKRPEQVINRVKASIEKNWKEVINRC